MNKEIEKILSDFSGVANKDNACSHSEDYNRWCTFLFACVDREEQLDPLDLKAWLRENGWKDEAVVDTLMEKFEYGLALLKAFKAHLS